ncbi:MAG: hypothetical protein WC812_04470 [Candidatus Pacearchaeota archaeon]|jgi:hypothetical protein
MSNKKSIEEIMKKIYIGINDIHGKRILNGDNVHVKFINYMGTNEQYVDEEFDGVIEYYPFNSVFYIVRPGKLAKDAHTEDEWEKYMINHRSMTLEKINN